jgi:glycosyltransferase involved in cell wall biosynthesis
MKILLITDPYIPVPPKGYGGIERVVELLALKFLKDKHEVDLLAGPNSYIEGALITTYGKNNFPPKREDKINALLFVWKFLWMNKSKYELVINYGRLINLIPILNSDISKISCYQREITESNVRAIFKLPYSKLKITGCSHNLVKRSNLESYCSVIHNCVNFSQYNLNENYRDDAPLIFLGRLEKIKGVHTAIEVALKTNNNLIIAGNISPLKEERQYFEDELMPLIDGEKIKYVGQVDDAQKNHFLGISKALLFPIEWDEPFGIVMIEAMACGTPVIGFGRGSVPEVIEDGITGYIVNTIDSMAESVLKLKSISRNKCREAAERRFDVSIIADKYINLSSI